jgi:hypothetical protein
MTGDIKREWLADVLLALDRCEHGRHAADTCTACPGGQSTGNLICPPGTRLGTDMYGRPILMPDPRVRYEAEYWLEEKERHSHSHRPRPV